MDNFFDRTATVDSGDEEEEEFDEETGEPVDRSRKSKATNGDVDDSSEEEDDDDDEEEARRIREGFIVDDPEEDDEAARERRRERKKRRREEREEDEVLDEEDLDLIGELHPDFDHRQAEKNKFKRLKRGHRDDRSANEVRGVEDIFSDEEEGGEAVAPARGRGAFGQYGDEMDDFIEQDEFPDEEGGQLDDDLGVRAPRRPGFADLQNLRESGLDEADLEDMRGAFGNGDEFGWALEAEAENNEELADPEKPLELKDVFEPSQLIEKMLTDDDNNIRMNDVPERFQLARKPYQDQAELPEEELAEWEAEEAKWVAGMLFPKKKNISPSLRGPFEQAVKTVLRFMNVEDYEPPFIFQNRKDYLIHSEQVPISPNPNNPGAPAYDIKAEKLLSQTDLWDVLEQDLKFRAFSERRRAIRTSVAALKEQISDFSDTVFDDLLPLAAQIDDLQDLQDYLNFQYSGRLKDVAAERAEANGLQKRAGGKRSPWDKVRQGPAYHLVRAFGITADQLAVNVDKSGRRTYTDDTDLRPDDLADTLVRDPDYPTGQSILAAAKAMVVEEIVMSPRLRRYMRQIYYEKLVFDVQRTEKGHKQIDEGHPYYEFKYLRGQKVRTMMLDTPEMFLRMLKAESEGLVEVRVRLQGERKVKEDLQKAIESDSFSEVADAWNELRREVLDTALAHLHKIISKGVKDNVRSECENKLAGYCRDAYTQKLDQAPWKPRGMEAGTLPRVLALSNGGGNRSDAICWAYLEENGRVLENGKFSDLRLPAPGLAESKDVEAFVELVERRKPDVVAVSGWSVETRRLYKDLQDIIEKHTLHGAPWTDDNDQERLDPLEVVIANDEVARLYHTSNRANAEHPGLPPLTRYAIGLAKYLQSPLKEYAALGRDIVSISFDPNQQLVPEDKLLKYLETAMVDMVNLVGVEINDAVNDPYTANLLPYICGLGPRKAAYMLKIINQNGGEIITREELVGDVDQGKRQAVGPKVWTNCSSFLYISYDDNEIGADYLDNTRIHPEDYDIARKMAADALEMDEEDIKAEVDENGNNAVVRKLIKDAEQDKVNDLLLEQYAEQLETKFSQRKRATLETIRAELQNPYEELRRAFESLTTEEIFTMLTGETRDTLADGMIVPCSVKRTFLDHLEVKLDCGIDGDIPDIEYPDEMKNSGLEPRQVWAPHQTIQAKLMFIDRKKLAAKLTLRESELSVPYRRAVDHDIDEWDYEQEARDKKELKKVIDAGTWRAQRVIKHPVFRPFNSSQAEQFLQPHGRGDCVIRPSSNGPDHLAVTWKIHDDMYQHIDVLELSKENEFSVGRILKIGGKYTYSDLDELIALHVKAMAKKVDEMMGDERYQSGSKQQTEQWLTTYTEANPKRSMYAFCLNPKHPGYFYLCFKAGQNAPLSSWPVKVIPNAFELQGHKYPDMRALKNGFKLLFANRGAAGAPGAAVNGRR
ncbi:transcription elongation factor SPT6 [Neohortaea acidophila]|uniref:Transcription elongation factor Spt6 n=1 Tax=Neohortaea acidophila TaxID=245834 RepID=A0A6A6Q060_9PEZI|nr:transcription elongation factor SPT6 [Neohortaea acidophila]KAF2485073.1 transcription elongation factor SPT6 [Neohortaea acidophila]